MVTRFGVQPIIATAGEAAGGQTYRLGEVTADGETVSLSVSCTNDLSAPGNRNLLHWEGEGLSYRIYKSAEGSFGLIGTASAEQDFFVDDNIVPDTAQQPV